MGSRSDEIDAAHALCTQYRSDCERLWYEDEQPQRSVYLSAYWIMRTEVTNALYAICVAEGGCGTPNNGVWQNTDFAGYPVTDVTWQDGADYAAWLSAKTGQPLRLPTEAQWEKAARGSNGRTFPWGNEWAAHGVNYCDSRCDREWRDSSWDDGYVYTAPVGTYPAGATPYGALDMAGNVWEWTADWYGAQYYSQAPTQNPSGPASGDHRVVRGAAWYHSPNFMRAADRHAYGFDHSRDSLGFRLVSLDPGR